MTCLLFLLFIITLELPAVTPVGDFSLHTFEKLKTQIGGSIVIPCFYGQKHKSLLKYWCKEDSKKPCITVKQSDSSQGMNKVTITDDPDNLVFLVTMKNLQQSDSGNYRCAVRAGQRRTVYMSNKLYLFFPAATVRTSTLKTFIYLQGKTGGSVTIPCFYSQEHKDRVKYWCKENNNPSCTKVILTMNMVTITDDPDNLVFLVTMRNLQQLDSDYYWCAVDGGQGETVDHSDKLLFLVTTNVQSVRTESWVSAERGGSVTIPCYYDQTYKYHVKYWCRGYEWNSCSRIAQSDRVEVGGKVSITDDRDQVVFNVTMRDLQEEDSDYYWCAVSRYGAPDDRAFLPLIVREADSTRQNSTETKTSTSILLVSLVIVLLLLLGVVMATLILKKRYKGRNRTKEKAAALTPSVDPEDEVTYTTVISKSRETSENNSKRITEKKTAAADPYEVIYSTVVRD